MAPSSHDPVLRETSTVIMTNSMAGVCFQTCAVVAWLAAVTPAVEPVSAPAGKTHWAFRQLVRPAVPVTDSDARVRTPVDRFVVSRLEDKRLSLSRDADRVTLMRRAYLDLVGFPPRPDEVESFVGDGSSDSYERLVDRLLTSPHFGERWGRHWLDAVGYTDTVGFDIDANLIVMPKGKWRYRDYVIRSLNADKPYDRFVREQLAGDEMVDWRNARRFDDRIRDHLIATGMLRTAADFTHEPESFIASNMYSVLFDTMEIVNTSLLGLTMHCARCHDHKFDPLPQRDYYRMMACFTPALNPKRWKAVYPWKPEIVDRAIDNVSAVQLKEFQQHNKRLDELTARGKQELVALRQSLVERLVQGKLAKVKPGKSAVREPVSDGLSLWLRADRGVYVDGDATTPARPGQAVTLWKDQLAGGNTAANDARQAAQAARPILVDDFGRSRSPALRFRFGSGSHLRVKDHLSLRSSGAGLTVFVMYRLNEIRKSDAQLVTKYAEDGRSHGNWGVDLFQQSGKPPNRPRIYFGNPAKPNAYGGGAVAKHSVSDQLPHQLTMVYDAGKVAIRVDGKPREVEAAGDPPPSPAFDVKETIDLLVGARVVTETGGNHGAGSFFPGDIAEILVYRHALPGKEIARVEQYLVGKYGPTIEVPDSEIAAALRVDPHAIRLRSRLATLAASRKEWGKIQPLIDVGPPPATHLLEGGDYLSPADVVAPGFIKVLSDGTNPDQVADENVDGSQTSGRRMALANWITRPDAPSSALLSRVMVNRVWQHLFGTGLVATSENFGVSGTPPTHPELLEWLANDFVRGGWRVKALIRNLMTSSVYRQASWRPRGMDRALAMSQDSENRLLWRMRLRRLDAEAIRDSVLAVSGRLDRGMSGPPIRLNARPDGLVVVDDGKLSTPSAKWRRSVYLMHRRAFNLSLLTAFDQPLVATTCSRRSPTAVVSQSLTMINDAFVFEQAGHFADRVLEMAGDTIESQVVIAFRLAVAREPTVVELQACSQLLKSQRARLVGQGGELRVATRTALVRLCHTILNTSELLYAE